ncbi:MAG: acetate--CoA ligase family protein [Bacteroidia bacterium]
MKNSEIKENLAPVDFMDAATKETILDGGVKGNKSKNRLKYIFEPKSVAVIGVSATPNTVGNAVFSNILQSNFKGVIFPVNPKYSNIMGVKAYKDVLSIPDEVDMAVICIPAKAVIAVLKQCAEKGVKGIVLITAGFKEVGKEGKAMEDEIIAIANKHNIAIIGPNVLGVINTHKDTCLNANFALKMPDAGSVALISQSGAIGVAALDYAYQHGLGISKFASIGNKAVIDESDVLEYLIDDDATKIITMYAEDISHPARFFELAKKASAKHKPILVIKTGRSVRGAIATHSHTGALSSSDTAYDALFAQCGVIRVEKLEELFEYAKGFTSLAQPKGNRIAVVTNGGGMGVIATDAAERSGLEMTTFEPGTVETLKTKLPPTASLRNPIDIIGDASGQRISDTLSVIAKDKNVDAIILSILPTSETDMNAIVANLCEFAKANPKMPILGNLLSLEAEPAFDQVLKEANIPNFDFPETDIRVLAAMVKYYEWTKQTPDKVTKFEAKKGQAEEVLNMVKKEKRTHLSEPESYKVLEAYGLKAVDYRVAKDLKEALVAATQIGYPVVLKITSPDIMHKIDVGGVKINLKDETDLKKAFNEIVESVKKNKPDAKIQGYLVQKYFTDKGIEIIVGTNAIKGFGSLIMFGLGGTFVELFKDVAFRLAPLTRTDALNMIKGTKGYQILKGYRGQPAYDIESIVDYLLRLSQLVTDFPEINELDMNPIKVLEKGTVIMDAKAIIE